MILHRSIIIALLLVAAWAGTIIDLHRNVNYPRDLRPRVWVRHWKDCSRQRYRQSLMFDTGSHRSHIVAAATPDCPRGYFLEGTSGGAGKPICTLWYGTGSYIRDLPVIAKVSEYTMCSGVYRFTQVIHLTATRDPALAIGIGLVGASRNSEFAKKAKFFIYVPQAPRDWPEVPVESAGMLVVESNEDEASTLAGQRCRREHINWIPITEGTYADNHWVLSGSQFVHGTPTSSAAEPVIWMVDTGARELYVTRDTYLAVVKSIERSGSRIQSSSLSETAIVDCRNYRKRFPTVTLVVGSSSEIGRFDRFAVDIRPEDYVEDVTADEMSCVLQLDYSDMIDEPNIRLLGMKFLRYAMTVFDLPGSRIGFCALQRSPDSFQLIPPAPVGSPWVPLGAASVRKGELLSPGCEPPVTGSSGLRIKSEWDPLREATVVHGGWMSVQSDTSTLVRANVGIWVIDPTMSDQQISVPAQVYDSVTEYIVSVGGVFNEAGGVVNYHAGEISSFPMVTLQLGDDTSEGDPIVLSLSPEQYMEKVPPPMSHVDEDAQSWRLKLTPIVARGDDHVVRVGPGALSEGLLVVDMIHSGVEFCISKAASALGVRMAEIPYQPHDVKTLGFPLDVSGSPGYVVLDGTGGGGTSAPSPAMGDRVRCASSTQPEVWTNYRVEGGHRTVVGWAESYRPEEYVTWTLDPNAQGFYLSEHHYRALVSSIRAAVGPFEPARGGAPIDRCPPDYRTAFPRIEIRMGKPPFVITRFVKPEQYVGDDGMGGCLLLVRPVRDAPVPLGPAAFPNELVIFDQLRGRVSVCPPAEDTPGKGIFVSVPLPVRPAVPMTATGSGWPEVDVVFQEQRLTRIHRMRLNTALDIPWICFGGNGIADSSRASETSPEWIYATRSEGYVDTGATRVQLHRAEVEVTSPEGVHWILQRIEETMLIPTTESRRPIAVAIHLTQVDTAACPTNGDLAADRTSQFAKAMGVFALIPTRTEAGNRLKVLVRARIDTHLSPHCLANAPITWAAPMARGEREWTVSGSVDEFITTWVIDSANPSVYLPETVLESTIGAIQAVTLYSRGVRKPGTVDACDPATLDKFPVIRVSIGVGVQVALTGYDYIYYNSVNGKCASRLRPWEPIVSRQVLGFPILNKVVSVFDHDLERMGFCHFQPAREPRSPRPLALLSMPSTIWLGNERDRVDCADPASGDGRRWNLANYDSNYGKWTVWGRAIGRDTGGDFATVPTLWVLDPSARAGLYLPRPLYLLVMSRLQGIIRSPTGLVGGILRRFMNRPISASPGTLEAGLGIRFPNCPPDVGQYPSVRLRLANVNGPYAPGSDVNILPDDYLVRNEGDAGCLCLIQPSPEGWSDEMAPLGPILLKERGAVVVLDSANSRVSVCAPRRRHARPVGGMYLLPRPVSPRMLVIEPYMLTSAPAGTGGAGPTIRVLLQEQGLNIIHTLSLNTAASSSSMPFGGNALTERGLTPRRFAAAGEGYLDTGAARVTFGRMAKGMVKRIEESATLLRTRAVGGVGHEFNVPLLMYLTNGDVVDARAELAADRASEFALTVGTFALIPNNVVGHFDVLVGERDRAVLDDHCAPGASVQWADVATDWVSWVAKVHVVGATESEWIVDSSLDQLSVPPAGMSLFYDQLVAVAGPVINETKFEAITACNPDVMDRLPEFRISANGVHVVLRGADYVFRQGDECLSRLRVAVPDHPADQILGIPFLRKVVSVFDRGTNRIGFCNAKFPL